MKRTMLFALAVLAAGGIGYGLSQYQARAQAADTAAVAKQATQAAAKQATQAASEAAGEDQNAESLEHLFCPKGGCKSITDDERRQLKRDERQRQLETFGRCMDQARSAEAMMRCQRLLPE